MTNTGADLIAQCQAALATGMDFPTLWHELLKGSPLVIGPPVQTMRGGKARLEVRLIYGSVIVFDSATKRITAE